MILISIPKPCHENWNEMSPREQGAFCNVCAKTVVDFTALSDEEVKNYFFQNREQKTCGRFRNDQLTSSENPLPQLLAASLPFWKKFLAIVFILFGSFISGCRNNILGTPAEKIEKHKSAIIGDAKFGIIIPDSSAKKEIADTQVICTESSVGIIESYVVDIDKCGQKIEVKPDTTFPVIDTIRKIILDENGSEKKEVEDNPIEP